MRTEKQIKLVITNLRKDIASFMGSLNTAVSDAEKMDLTNKIDKRNAEIKILEWVIS
jgi:hypothetical protein